jgi:hypothetical protein
MPQAIALMPAHVTSLAPWQAWPRSPVGMEQSSAAVALRARDGVANRANGEPTCSCDMCVASGRMDHHAAQHIRMAAPCAAMQHRKCPNVSWQFGKAAKTSSAIDCRCESMENTRVL